MKRCPTCNRTFTERNLSFCLDDGTPLIPVPSDDESTAVSPSSKSESATAPSSKSSETNWNAPAYQPPSSHIPPGSTKRRRTWPWVVAILGIILMAIVGMAAAIAIMVPRFLATANRNRPPASVTVGNRNDSNPSPNTNANTNENANANTNESSRANTNAAENLNPPSTDSAKVLADLTELEDDWTVANINADTKALERILADDYVGITDGREQGKKQYLHDIQRDTSIEKWDFEDLKVDLKGDRATLTGIVKFIVGGNEVKYRFIDKFVWRDGRWQATASQVDPVK